MEKVYVFMKKKKFGRIDSSFVKIEGEIKFLLSQLEIINTIKNIEFVNVELVTTKLNYCVSKNSGSQSFSNG